MATAKDNKLVQLSALVRFNHDLITRLGLTNDTALYAYAVSDAKGKKVSEITKANNVKKALDQLYDLIESANAATLNSSDVKVTNNTATVSLDNVSGGTTTNLTSVDIVSVDDNLVLTGTAKGEGTNAAVNYDIKSVGADKTDGTGTTTGDTSVTDPLTQKSYVDNEINKLQTLTNTTYASGKSSATGATEVKFTQDGTTKKYYFNTTIGGKVYNIELDGTDFLVDGFLQSVEYNATDKTIDFTWNADAKITKTSINVSDLLGNLTAGNGIDATALATGEIAVSLADQTANKYVKLKFDDGGKLDVETVTKTVSSSKDASGNTTWSSAGDGLATSQNVAAVATELQTQIDNIGNKHTSVKAVSGGSEATTSNAIYVDKTAATESEGDIYTVTYATCDNSDIDEIFGITA